jgi:outer membrane lipoprotein-sorting protein
LRTADHEKASANGRVVTGEFRFVRFFICLFVLLVVSGLLAWTAIAHRSDQPISAEQVVHRMRKVEASIDDAHSVLEIDLDAGVIQDRWILEVWKKRPDFYRIELLETSQSTLRGLTVVVVGQQAWLYDPAHREVTTGEPGTVRLPLAQGLITWLEDLIRTAKVETISLEGETNRAYKLSFGQALVWVDRESWTPFKIIYTHPTLGHGTIIVRQAEFNTGLTDDLFRSLPQPVP